MAPPLCRNRFLFPIDQVEVSTLESGPEDANLGNFLIVVNPTKTLLSIPHSGVKSFGFEEASEQTSS